MQATSSTLVKLGCLRRDLYSYKARDYMASIGRLLQTDPAGCSAGMNLYAYAEDDPVNLSDPTGLDGCAPSSSVPACSEPLEKDPPPVGLVVTGVRTVMVTFLPSEFPTVFKIDVSDFIRLTPPKKPFNVLPSEAYRQCLAAAVGSDGTMLGTLLTGAGFFGAGTPIIDKTRTGLGGGGPSGQMTSAISLATRSIPGLRRSAGPGLRSVGAYFSPAVSRSAPVAGNLVRIGSELSLFVSTALAFPPVDKFVAAAKKCEASVGR